jgi:hypothetical protein
MTRQVFGPWSEIEWPKASMLASLRPQDRFLLHHKPNEPLPVDCAEIRAKGNCRTLVTYACRYRTGQSEEACWYPLLRSSRTTTMSSLSAATHVGYRILANGSRADQVRTASDNVEGLVLQRQSNVLVTTYHRTCTMKPQSSHRNSKLSRFGLQSRLIL